MDYLIFLLVAIIVVGLAFYFVKRNKDDCVVKIAAEEKELDGSLFYMIAVEHKSGKRYYLNKKPLTIEELDSDEVVEMINAKINQ